MKCWGIGAVAMGLAMGLALTTKQPVSAVGREQITTADLKQKIDQMSSDEQIGQLFVSHVPATTAQARADVAKYHLGGLVLFGRDFQAGSAETLKQTIDGYQAAAKVPLLIATDQEGGTVSRLSDSPSYQNTNFPSPQDAYEAGGMSSVLYQAKLTAQALKYVGVNWNFAPIADVATSSSNYIYDRTFGKDYQQTADYIKQVVPVMQQQGVGATLKHFPGYGSAGDTHTGFAKTSTPYAELAKKDLLPFKAGIDAGVDGIMVTHIVMQAIDDTYPASLSHKVITGVLRQKLGYQGVIITDGLEMGAIGQFKRAHNIASIDVLALQAGDDALLAEDYATQIPAIKAAIKAHHLTTEQIKAADLHLLQLKNKLGLLKADDYIQPKLQLSQYQLQKKSATASVQVTMPGVKANTKLNVYAKHQLVGTLKLPKSGELAMKVSRTQKVQKLTFKMAGHEFDQHLWIAARAN
ncbi:glycoside hydrolase family 3 N-terminal domain-containing protein [Lacticaseibacillus manihotivorans]|uniref:beta-N-acetylhexosaminidase n=2 Tax=Lacticaseibacillus manihotivorans TaxID=88233 RepID=A0A0R1PZ94_9LACO|nr:glycoside hydrolase family 3 N-terminal domain-containing protein [Lacticaseibacillus manihotivorans]KRL37831.1 beta-N-acetylhexosaminidase [Lacticaseibacillus manihotivorans DSM 13343 = JCM 12514]